MSILGKVFGRDKDKRVTTNVNEEDKQGTRRVNELVATLKALQKTDKERGVALVEELAGLGEPAIPALAGALAWEWDWRHLHFHIENALVKMGRPAAVELVSALAKNGCFVAKEALVRIGEPAVEPLIAALQSENEETLFHAARALGSISDTRALEPLFRLYEHAASGRVRTAAGLALGQFGHPNAVPTLIFELRNQNFCREAIESLVKIGSSAVEPLIAALWDQGKTCSPGTDNLMKVLGMIGDPRAVEVLKAQTAPGKPPTIRNLALEALSRLGVQMEVSAEEASRLREALLSNDYETRKTALRESRLVSSSIDDAAFQRALQASERLQLAFDHQTDACSSTEPIEACQDAIRLEPDFSAAYTCLSYLYRQYAKNLNEALAWAQRAVNVDPQDVQAWTELGRVYVALRDVIGAARAFHKVVITEPQHADLEPDARLAPIYRKLGMQDLMRDATLRLTNAGIGLDPRHEREWEQLVSSTNTDQLRKAVEKGS